MIRKTSKVKPRSPMDADIEMGKRIRARRVEQNMSQDELGKILVLDLAVALEIYDADGRIFGDVNDQGIPRRHQLYDGEKT